MSAIRDFNNWVIHGYWWILQKLNTHVKMEDIDQHRQ